MDDGRLYLDDLSVGQRFTTGEYALDAEGTSSSRANGTRQPFHTDPEAAEGTFFGGLAASGWHTAAITMRLLVQDLADRRGPHRRQRRDLLARARPAPAPCSTSSAR